MCAVVTASECDLQSVGATMTSIRTKYDINWVQSVRGWSNERSLVDVVGVRTWGGVVRHRGCAGGGRIRDTDGPDG